MKNKIVEIIGTHCDFLSNSYSSWIPLISADQRCWICTCEIRIGPIAIYCVVRI